MKLYLIKRKPTPYRPGSGPAFQFDGFVVRAESEDAAWEITLARQGQENPAARELFQLLEITNQGEPGIILESYDGY